MGAQDLLLRILAKNETKAAFSEVKSGLSSLTGALAGFGVGLSALGVAKFSAEAIQLAASAGPVENAFNSMAASLGRNADSMLADLQSISRGAIDQTALMTAANTAMLLGGRTLASELPTLLEVARAGSIALGQDMQFMFQSIITGIARQSPLILDNLGIVVDLETANKQYAASLGITVEAMTEAQKQQALLNDILRGAPDYIANVGADATTAAENIKSLEASSKELKTAWGELLLELGADEALAGAAQEMRDFTNETAQADFQQLITDLKGLARWMQLDGQTEAAKNLSDGINGLTRSSLPLETMNERLRQLRAAALGLDPTKVNALFDSISDLVGLRGEIEGTADAIASLTIPDPLAERGAELEDRQQAIYAAALRRRLAREQEAEEEATAASRYVEEWRSAYQARLSEARSMAEAVLSSGTQVTPLDMAQTAAGTYQDKPLEAARRLADIANLGLESPWAKFFEIPPDVLAAGSEAIKAWATEVQGDVENLARPDLIDWDAFVAEFQRQKDEATAKALTLDIAMGKLAQAGLLTPGNEAQSKLEIAQMLGLDTPELAAASIAQGFQTAFDANNPASALLSSFQTKLGTQETAYKTTGEKAGGWLGDSIKGAALTSLDGFLPDLAARLSPYLVLPGGSPPP